MSNFKATEQFASANKTAVDALLTVANTALASAERIAALNLNTARSFIEDGVANTKAMMGVKDIQEAVSMQSSISSHLLLMSRVVWQLVLIQMISRR